MSKSNTSSIANGAQVEWKWGRGTAKGRVIEIYHGKTTKQIKGSQITRKGSKDDPALLIKQESGKSALKLAHEVKRIK